MKKASAAVKIMDTFSLFPSQDTLFCFVFNPLLTPSLSTLANELPNISCFWTWCIFLVCSFQPWRVPYLRRGVLKMESSELSFPHRWKVRHHRQHLLALFHDFNMTKHLMILRVRSSDRYDFTAFQRSRRVNRTVRDWRERRMEPRKSEGRTELNRRRKKTERKMESPVPTLPRILKPTLAKWTGTQMRLPRARPLNPPANLPLLIAPAGGTRYGCVFNTSDVGISAYICHVFKNHAPLHFALLRSLSRQAAVRQVAI